MFRTACIVRWGHDVAGHVCDENVFDVPISCRYLNVAFGRELTAEEKLLYEGEAGPATPDPKDTSNTDQEQPAIELVSQNTDQKEGGKEEKQETQEKAKQTKKKKEKEGDASSSSLASP